LSNDSSASKNDSKLHIALVHEGNKQFKCELCDHSFLQKGALKIHLTSVHEGIRPFKCELCEHSFSHKGHMLNQHVPSIHGGTKPFKCGICDKKFQRFMTGPILEKNHMLAIMVRKFQERNLLKGKALDFEMILQERIQTDDLMRNSYIFLK
jgi:uncharacterized Zn-finger protein